MTGQSVNCDFIIENRSPETWAIRSIVVSVHDASGKLEARRFVNDNGNSPSIDTLNERRVRPGQRILIFNPLFSFGDELQLTVLAYRFTWVSEDGRKEITTELSLKPETYRPRRSLRLPLKGRTLVWDGHDYYAHHRRFNYMSQNSQAAGTRSNPDRYGYDLIAVNEAGDMRYGDPDNNANWFGFGQPVYAAGEGRVVAVVDDGLDNREVDQAQFDKNKLADYGNYIVVDQGGGEFALYGHLRNGSARVKAGETVHQGQRLAAIGASGSSLMPHLHFQLQTSASADAEGLPSYFDQFVRLVGSRSLAIAHGPIDSGDIIEAVP
jgi:murein DD-endopeptidase MepM/ murein hydrolase activator NlpD